MASTSIDEWGLERLFDQAPGLMALLRGPNHTFAHANRAYLSVIGNRDVIGKPMREALPEIAEQGFVDLLDEVYRTGTPYVGRQTRVLIDKEDGQQTIFADFVFQPVRDDRGDICGIFIEGHDVTASVESQRQLVLQNRLLELTVSNAPLPEILACLLRAVEEESDDGLIGSILLFDPESGRLRHGAAPSLPAAYNEAIDGVAIGPAVGSCGTAAWRKEPVFVDDINSDPLWKDFRELALSHGLRACWSLPILSTGKALLGTFALYYREPKEPHRADREVIEYIARSAALVIEKKSAEEKLEEETRTLETLNRIGAAVAAELDHERLVQLVTDAAVELTGAQFGAFFYNTVDDQGEAYMLYTLSGVDRSAFENFPMPRNTAVFSPTFAGEGPVRSDDITKDPRYGDNAPYKGMPEGHLPVCSYLAVPVISRSGEVLGGLFFGHSDAGVFTERHERLLVGVAAHAATAIDNAQLYKEAQNEIEVRTVTEERLRDVTRRLDAVLNNTRMAVFVMDQRQHCSYANAAAEELTGYTFEQMQGRPLHDVIHHTRPDGSHYPLDECPIDRAFPENMQTDGEEIFVRPDGSFYPVAFTASPIRDEESKTIGTIIEARDITDERQRAAELADALQVKDVLLHEVNHRVKNSLQVVTSLLRLQANQIEEPELRASLLEARDRVAVVASMHQRLYSTSEHDRVDFSDYLSASSEEAVRALDTSQQISLEREIEPGVILPIAMAVPLALIVNELITNAIKYAFAGREEGCIQVRLVHRDNQLVIEVVDDGVGLDEDFDPAKSDGLGMKIVNALVRQTRGKLTVGRNDSGAAFVIAIEPPDMRADARGT